MNTRRQFLMSAPLGLLAGAATWQKQETQSPQPAPAPAGAPHTFGTGTGAGPAVTTATFAEAEKLMQISMTEDERKQAAASWRESMAGLLERRTGPRKVALADTDPPATIWDPLLPGITRWPARDRFVRSPASDVPLPSSDDDIAFQPVTQLSRWIEARKLTSERLTNIYLKRIERFDPSLRAIITLTTDAALDTARSADAEIAAGKYRGPLHGIPYGVKDLLEPPASRLPMAPSLFGIEFPRRIRRSSAG